MHDDFLAKCRSLDPSAEIDREKNRKIIKTRLLEEENVVMLKNKRIRRPAMVAAILVGILSLSVVAYAAVPAIWRHFDTQVIQGEEFITDFWVAETDMPDGTVSVGGTINIDREALAAAGGGAVIVEVDGEEWVVLDELHLDNLRDGLALLQIENPLLPRFLPEGFAFNRMTFPVNPTIHQYQSGSIPAAKHAFIYYSNGDSTIQLQMLYFGSGTGLGAGQGQQALVINGNKAIALSGGLTERELSRLDGVTLYDSSTNWEEYHSSFWASAAPGTEIVSMMFNGVVYSLRSEDVSLYDLVRMIASTNFSETHTREPVLRNDSLPRNHAPDITGREGRSSQQSPEEIEAIMRERGLLAP